MKISSKSDNKFTPQPEPNRCDSCDWTFGCFDGGEPCQKKPQSEPQPPTDVERGMAFEWLRKIGLSGTTHEARLAYVAMQTMLNSAPEPQPEPQTEEGQS